MPLFRSDAHLLLGALLASLAFHCLLLLWLPPLPVGRVPAFSPRRGMQFHIVERSVPRVRKRRLPAALRKWQTVTREEISEPSVSPPRPVPGMRPRLPLAAAAPGRMAHISRLKRLEICQARIPEESALLPRRVVPTLPEPALESGGQTEPAPLETDTARAGGYGRGVEHAAGAAGIAGRTAAPGRPGILRGKELVRYVEQGGGKGPGPECSVDRCLRFRCRSYRGGDGFTYFRLEVTAAGMEGVPVLPKDVFFMVDCSESMGVWRMRASARAVEVLLGSMVSAADRFDIGAFREFTLRCFGSMHPADEAARLTAELFLRNLKCSGRTDILGSLQTILETEARQPAVAVIFTDARPTAGAVDGIRIINEFSRRNAGYWQVYALCPGRRRNRLLLRFLSIPNRGTAVLAADDRDLLVAAQKLGQQLARPVLRNITCVFSHEVETGFRRIPDLYLDNPLLILGRVRQDTDSVAVRLSGTSAAGPREAVAVVDLAAAEEGGAEIRQEWARQRVFSLVSEYFREADPEVLDEAQRIAADNGIPMPYSRSVVPLW